MSGLLATSDIVSFIFHPDSTWRYKRQFFAEGGLISQWRGLKTNTTYFGDRIINTLNKSDCLLIGHSVSRSKLPPQHIAPKSNERIGMTFNNVLIALIDQQNMMSIAILVRATPRRKRVYRNLFGTRCTRESRHVLLQPLVTRALKSVIISSQIGR